MARLKGDKIENNFIKGLITEKSPIAFPKDSATDCLNVIFDEKGRFYRRPGINIEYKGSLLDYTPSNKEVFTEFQWTSAGGIGSKTFFVQQIGSYIYLYDVSLTETISAKPVVHTIDLNTFLPTGSPYIPGEYQCQYSKGNGTCLVSNPVCDTFFIDYDYDTNTISTTKIILKVRDFEGLEDGVNEDTRLTGTVASVSSANPEYIYNLLNQGWSQTDALDQWDTARSDLPSKRDIVGLYRGSETDAFDDLLVTSKSPGTTPAPKGHFIIEANTSVRQSVAAAEGYSLDLGELNNYVISTDYTRSAINTVSFNNNLLAADDGNTNLDAASSTNGPSLAYVSGSPSVYFNIPVLAYEFSSPSKISSVTVYGSNDQGFWSNASYVDTRLYLFGGTGPAPTNINSTVNYDRTRPLGFIIFNDTSDESNGRVIFNSNDSDSLFDWFVIEIGTKNTSSSNSTVINIAQVNIHSTQNTFQRATTNAFYQGRAWYAGFESEQSASTIYFSQIIENKDQYGRCYQRQDPTNEYFNSLLPTDGGTIRILDIEKVVKLFSTQSSIIVFATNGVWEITGNPYFTANNFSIRKMTAIGCFSPMSVVDYRGIPIWWGEDGIYSIQFDPQFQTFQITNFTEDTIKSFINNITPENRLYVKGAYDLLEDTVYWLYNTTDVLTSDLFYKYDAIIALNRRSLSFYPWTFDTTNNNVRGLFYYNPVEKSPVNKMKYIYTNNTDQYSFAEFNDHTYKDWNEIFFNSYVVSGYDINETALKHGSPNYVQVYVDLRNYTPYIDIDMTDDPEEHLLTTDNDSHILTIEEATLIPEATFRAVYDFIKVDNVYRWSKEQQVYPVKLENRASNFRRLKVRGKGKSIQFRIDSVEGKPFIILGWASAQTSNADV